MEKTIPSHGVDARFVCFKDPDGTIIEYVQFAGDAGDILTSAANPG